MGCHVGGLKSAYTINLLLNGFFRIAGLLFFLCISPHPALVFGADAKDHDSTLEGKIVWETNRDGNWEIYRMNPDGSGITRLTQNRVSDSRPRWSEDGTRIYFERAGQDGVPNILSMTEQGKDEKVLVKNGSNYSVGREGKSLLFERSVNRKFVFFELDLATGKEKTLLLDDVREVRDKENRGPVLSPDGNRLGFTYRQRGWNVVTLDLDSRTLHHVGRGCEPVWSPDGTRIMWTRARGIGRTSIWSADPKGGSPAVISDMASKRSHEYFPQWSNDGKFAVFAACPNTQHDQDRSDYDIFITGVEPGSEPKRLTADPHTDRYPSLYVSPSRIPGQEGDPSAPLPPAQRR